MLHRGHGLHAVAGFDSRLRLCVAAWLVAGFLGGNHG